MKTNAAQKITRREAIAKSFNVEMDRQTREKAKRRIRQDPLVPIEVKRYMLDLMERRKELSVLTVNMFLRTVPQIIVGKNISKRKTLADFLQSRGYIRFKPRPITMEEKRRYRSELVKERFFSEAEVAKIMGEIEKRPKISELGAHAIVHYFLCVKILDRIAGKKGKV